MRQGVDWQLQSTLKVTGSRQKGRWTTMWQLRQVRAAWRQGRIGARAALLIDTLCVGDFVVPTTENKGENFCLSFSFSMYIFLPLSLFNLTCARLAVSRCLLRGTAAGHRRDSSRVHRIRRSWRLCRPAAAPRRRGCQLAPVDEGRADE